MATLGLEEMGKFRWEGREKENAKKNLVFHFGGGHHASFPQKPVAKINYFILGFVGPTAKARS